MVINGKPFNPGEMRTPITIESRSASTDSGGFQTPAWTTIATVKSKWVNVHGSEVWNAELVQAEEPATVMIRYLAGLDRTCSVVKNGKRFEIVSIDDIQDRHELMELKVKRLGAG